MKEKQEKKEWHFKFFGDKHKISIERKTGFFDKLTKQWRTLSIVAATERRVIVKRLEQTEKFLKIISIVFLVLGFFLLFFVENKILAFMLWFIMIVIAVNTDKYRKYISEMLPQIIEGKDIRE